MFLIEDNSDFKPGHYPHIKASVGDFIFIYKDNKTALNLKNELLVINKLPAHIKEKNFYSFGLLHHHPCLLWESDEYDLEELSFVDTKQTLKLLSKSVSHAVAMGNHYYHWRSSHRYCGKCAASMLDKSDELAKICSKCQHLIYPRISPCIIVLITRGEEMLLARSPHFPAGVMSTLAGFVAIGESVEQALIREVQEEVGIQIDNLTYVCSQPWPFPDSLMLGFTAEYKGGELRIDKNEIEAVGWFTKKDLPLLPNELSIARYLIELHLSKNFN